MSERSNVQREKAYEFLLEKFQSQESFSKQEMKDYTSYPKGSSFNTVSSKKFQKYLRKVKEDRYKVKISFKKYLQYDDFKKYFSQTTNQSSGYKRYSHSNLIIFDFYLPLTKETELKQELNSLFYKDTVIHRLRNIGYDRLIKLFERHEDESEEFYNNIADFISSIFIGYSIDYVQGRFRSGPLRTFNEVCDLQKKYSDYLIDETTAIVRFIIPIGSGQESNVAEEYLDTYEEIEEDIEPSLEIIKLANLIREIFRLLFIEAVLEVVDEEEEIWVLESGMRSKLHRFCLNE